MLPSLIRRIVSTHPCKSLLWSALLCLPACGPKKEAPPVGTVEPTAPGKVSETPGKAAEPEIAPLDHPASPAEAARVLNLTTFPLIPGSQNPSQRTIANLLYRAPGDVKAGYEFQRKNLLELKWKELPNAAVTDQYASGMFTRAGFSLSVSVMPSRPPGNADVTLHNLGNVDLSKLPLPPNTKPVYVGPASAMHVTEAAVPATADACRQLLLADGWEPYGTAGDSAVYKKNAVQLHATVQSAPAQGGKTMISYIAEQLSADIPAPPEAEDLRYVDLLRRLGFQTSVDKAAVAAFYKQALAKKGWKANQEELLSVDKKFIMAFRNADKDLLWMDVLPGIDGKQIIEISYQSGAEVTESERQADAEGAAIKAKREAETAK